MGVADDTGGYTDGAEDLGTERDEAQAEGQGTDAMDQPGAAEDEGTGGYGGEVAEPGGDEPAEPGAEDETRYETQDGTGDGDLGGSGDETLGGSRDEPVDRGAGSGDEQDTQL